MWTYNKNLDNLSIKLLEYLKWLVGLEWKSMKELMEDIWIDHPQKLYDRLEKLIKGGFIDEDFNYIRWLDDTKIFLNFFGWAQCWNYWPKWFEDYPTKKIEIGSDNLEWINLENASKYFITRAKWKSMEPEIYWWNNVLVKFWDKSWIKRNTKYLIKHNERAKIKYLEKKNNWVNLKSLNIAYPDLFVNWNKDDFVVIWEVIRVLE
jgi:hypothetical protein